MQIQNLGNPRNFVIAIIVLIVAVFVSGVVISSDIFKPSINYPDVANSTWWGISYKLDFNSIPSIINGITSATSIIIGFTGTIVGILYGVFFKNYDKELLFLIPLIVLVPLIMLYMVYNYLIMGVVDSALKLALFAFIYSFLILAIALLGSFYRLAKNENSQENQNRDENNNEENDFRDFIDKFEKIVPKEDLKASLRILLDRRLDFHSQSLTTSRTLSVSVILGLIALAISLFDILLKTSDLLTIGTIAVLIVVSVYYSLDLSHNLKELKNKRESEEREITRQYLTAIAELNGNNQE